MQGCSDEQPLTPQPPSSSNVAWVHKKKVHLLVGQYTRGWDVSKDNTLSSPRALGRCTEVENVCKCIGSPTAERPMSKGKGKGMGTGTGKGMGTGKGQSGHTRPLKNGTRL